MTNNKSFIDWAQEYCENEFEMYPEIPGKLRVGWVLQEVQRKVNFHVCEQYPIHCSLCAMQKLLEGYRKYAIEDVPVF